MSRRPAPIPLSASRPTRTRSRITSAEWPPGGVWWPFQLPEKTALEDYGNPEPGIGTQEEAQMVIATRTGAAEAVSREIAAAELPTDPHRLVVTPPQSPLKLQGEVNGDLAGLFLILALISLL